MSFRSAPNQQSVKKPPPIIVSDQKLLDIEKLIKPLVENKTLNENVDYKLSGNNIHIYAKTVSDHKLIVETCKNSTLQFNTHQLYEERRVKVCLFGLTEIPVDDIKNELINKHKITPADIKMMKTNPNNKSEVRNYLLYFRKLME